MPRFHSPGAVEEPRAAHRAPAGHQRRDPRRDAQNYVFGAGRAAQRAALRRRHCIDRRRLQCLLRPVRSRRSRAQLFHVRVER